MMSTAFTSFLLGLHRLGKSKAVHFVKALFPICLKPSPPKAVPFLKARFSSRLAGESVRLKRLMRRKGPDRVQSLDSWHGSTGCGKRFCNPYAPLVKRPDFAVEGTAFPLPGTFPNPVEPNSTTRGLLK